MRRKANSSCTCFASCLLSVLTFLVFRGNFAESFGEDIFGLKELGIADEFGLSSLTVPKRLLKGKRGGIKEDLEAYVFLSVAAYSCLIFWSI